MAVPSIEPHVQRYLRTRPRRSSRFTWPHAYASEALKCSRQVAFRVLGPAVDVEAEPFPFNALIAFRIGEDLHDLVQCAFEAEYPNFRREVEWSQGEVTGRADGLYGDEDLQIVVEIKSVNRDGFMRAKRRDQPHIEHEMQANISAYALQAALLHIVYVNKGAKPGEPVMLEWLIPATPDAAELELDRLRSIVTGLTSTGTLPDRFMDGDVIDDPAKKKWPCAYCDYRPTCIALGPGRVALSHGPVDGPSLTVRAADFGLADPPIGQVPTQGDPTDA